MASPYGLLTWRSESPGVPSPRMVETDASPAGGGPEADAPTAIASISRAHRVVMLSADHAAARPDAPLLRAHVREGRRHCPQYGRVRNHQPVHLPADHLPRPGVAYEDIRLAVAVQVARPQDVPVQLRDGRHDRRPRAGRSARRPAR